MTTMKVVVVMVWVLVGLCLGQTDGADKRETSTSCAFLLNGGESTEKYRELSALYDLRTLVCLLGRRLQLAYDLAAYRLGRPDYSLSEKGTRAIINTWLDQADSLGLSPTWAAKFLVDQMSANMAAQEHLMSMVKNGTLPKERLRHRANKADISGDFFAVNSKIIAMAAKTSTLRASVWCGLLLETESEEVARQMEFDSRLSYLLMGPASNNVCTG